MQLPNAEELREQMSHLEDEELLKIVMTDSSDYRQIAIDAANKELQRRYANPTNSKTSITYKKVSHPISYMDVFRWIWVIYILVFSIPGLFKALYQYHLFDSFLHDLSNAYAIPTAIVGGLLILPLGISLYAFREKYLALYAYLEITFGIFYGIYTIGEKSHWGTISDSSASNLASWTALAASLYIVVRGLDNRNKAKKVRKLEVK